MVQDIADIDNVHLPPDAFVGGVDANDSTIPAAPRVTIDHRFIYAHPSHLRRTQSSLVTIYLLTPYIASEDRILTLFDNFQPRYQLGIDIEQLPCVPLFSYK